MQRRRHHDRHRDRAAVLNRRTLLRLGAAGVAAIAVGGGAWLRSRRQADALRSDRITGEWPAVGPGVQWLLPDLRAARMVVPDRPHSVEETRDPAARARMRRVRTFHVTTNSRRLRGENGAGPPAAGVKRLVAIGDSVTFGWGVTEAEAWPSALERELRGRGHAVEVLNAGVPAQRLEHMAAWLARIAPGLGIDGVLFARRPYPQGGDPAAAYASAVAQARQALPRARFHVLLPPVSRFDPHGMQVYREEGRQLAPRLAGTPVLELTDALRAAQGDHGCGLIEEGGRLRLVRMDTGAVLLEAAVAEHDLPRSVYDLLESDPGIAEALFFDGGHPDAEGLAVVGRAVADAIEEARWFS